MAGGGGGGGGARGGVFWNKLHPPSASRVTIAARSCAPAARFANLVSISLTISSEYRGPVRKLVRMGEPRAAGKCAATRSLTQAMPAERALPRTGRRGSSIPWRGRPRPTPRRDAAVVAAVGRSRVAVREQHVDEHAVVGVGVPDREPAEDLERASARAAAVHDTGRIERGPRSRPGFRRSAVARAGDGRLDRRQASPRERRRSRRARRAEMPEPALPVHDYQLPTRRRAESAASTAETAADPPAPPLKPPPPNPPGNPSSAVTPLYQPRPRALHPCADDREDERDDAGDGRDRDDADDGAS